MKAIAKTTAAPGISIIDVEEPQVRPGHIKMRVERASVCGTDLHIYNWDQWAQGRIHPTRIIGHEFCGTIVEVGEGVADREVGQFVSSESHIIDPGSPDYLRGEGHVDRTTRILGVDVDGGFSPYAVIPELNARPTNPAVPKTIASMLDAVGNAVHTVMDGPVEGQSILILGLGPIGLFAAAACRSLGARRVVCTEVSAYRMNLARQLGVTEILNPLEVDVAQKLADMEPFGFDGVLEMSGRAESLALAIQAVRRAGRISLLGLFPQASFGVSVNDIVLKGIRVQGIAGRRMWQTWDEMNWLLAEKGLDLAPVVTHEMHFTDVEKAFEVLKRGEAGKIVLTFED